MFSETTFLMVFGLGAACMLLGFYLVVRGVGASDSESAVKLIGIEIRASKVGPGVLFALFGLVLVVTAIAKLQGPAGAPRASWSAPEAPAPKAATASAPQSVGGADTARAGGDDLVGALSRRNLRSSLGEATLRDWLSGDTHYRRLAQACLAALGERRLAGGGADLLKVNYFYLQQLGVQDEAQLADGHVIQPAALQRALVLAYRDMNGGAASSLSEIAR